MEWVTEVVQFLGILGVALIGYWGSRERDKVDAPSKHATAAESISNASSNLVDQLQEELQRVRLDCEGFKSELEVQRMHRQDLADRVGKYELRMLRAESRVMRLERFIEELGHDPKAINGSP